MKAVGFYVPTKDLLNDSFQELTLPDPVPGASDLLVEPHAVSINPVDYKERQKRVAPHDGFSILGWDGAGVVKASGEETTGFNVGDKVFWSGEFNRPGSNATLQSVDYRLVGRMPSNLNFADAAALPLTGITAYEALFKRLRIPNQGAGKVLIIGGAGGVGSIAIQLLKLMTDAKVYATAGREDSKQWVTDMGADYVIDRNELKDSDKRRDLPQFDYVFSTTHSDSYHAIFPEIIKVGGGLALIDDPAQFDIGPFKPKSITVSWELIFSEALFQNDLASQGWILNKLSQMVEAGKLRSTAKTFLRGLNPQTLVKAHKLQESGTTIGKTVIGC
jgi:NADPH2:quinone reductase